MHHRDGRHRRQCHLLKLIWRQTLPCNFQEFVPGELSFKFVSVASGNWVDVSFLDKADRTARSGLAVLRARTSRRQRNMGNREAQTERQEGERMFGTHNFESSCVCAGAGLAWMGVVTSPSVSCFALCCVVRSGMWSRNTIDFHTAHAFERPLQVAQKHESSKCQTDQWGSGRKELKAISDFRGSSFPHVDKLCPGGHFTAQCLLSKRVVSSNVTADHHVHEDTAGIQWGNHKTRKQTNWKSVTR